MNNTFFVIYPNKRVLILTVFLLVTCSSFAQSVGIGGAINENAVLAISSTSQGILLPRLTSVEREAIPSPANGLMVYDKSRKSFYYFNSRAGWVEMKPTPAGTITMWYGDISKNFDGTGLGIKNMKGWAICNGNYGTPNLQGSFILGHGAGAYPEAEYRTGGSESRILSLDKMPSHSHAISDPGHSHSVAFTETTSHSHSFQMAVSDLGSSYATSVNAGTSLVYAGEGTTEYSGTLDAPTFDVSMDGGSANLSVNSAGSGDEYDALPPYYILVYIRKLP